VRPFTIREGLESMTSIGIVNASSLRLNPAEPVQDGSAAAEASPKLTGQDTVVGVDGQPVSDSIDLQAYFAKHPDRPLTLNIERTTEGFSGKEKIDVTVPPQRLRDIGLIMGYGAITSIEPDSPASKAGFRVGDRIVAVNSKPLNDAMLLPEILRPFYGREVEITVERPGQSSPEVLKPVVEAPTSYEWTIIYGGSMASDALGVAYEVTRQVREVVPGSPADKAGFRPGDVVTGMEFSWQEKKPGRKARRSHDTVFQFDDRQTTWPRCFYSLQQLHPDEVLKLMYERQGKTLQATLQPVEVDGFNPDRGLIFDARSEIHQAQSWGEAVRLGARQTWEDAFRVAEILKKLVTGRVSVANLGGIGSIAYVAGSEASRGTTRLLIFLTMLSANLAVLNFLPIPALDGGHMMFLMYEGIFRKPVNERLQYVLTIAGVLCLLGLMIFVNAMDFHRFFF
jgi:regulator of sigma E protease